MALYVARMGIKPTRSVGIIDLIDMWFNIYLGSVDSANFIGRVELSFCPSVGEFLVYFGNEYCVTKVVHAEKIVLLVVG